MGSFWVYLIRPVFNFFSKNITLGEAVSKLQIIMAFLREGKESVAPISYITKARDIFDVEVKDDEIEFSNNFMIGCNNGYLAGIKLPDVVFDEMELLARNIFSRLLKKYEADWSDFLNLEINYEDSRIVLPFSNSRVESVFGIFKDDSISTNTKVGNLIDRTELVFNKTINYIMDLDVEHRAKLISESRKKWSVVRESNEQARISHDTEKNERDLARVVFKQEKD